MNRFFSKVYKSLTPDPASWKFWISISIGVKLLIFILEILQHKSSYIPGIIGSTNPDTESYLLPVENLLATGSYSPDYRMPGYAVLYFPLRLIFSQQLACDVLVIVQLLFAAVAVYFLALTALTCFKKPVMFYLVFYTFAISTYASIFDSMLLSESLCTSATIFSVYFFCRFPQNRNPINLFFSGLFLTWTIFLRPMYAPLLAIFGVVLLWNEIRIKTNWPSLATKVILFFVPFGIIESAWMIRNYNEHHRIVILTTSLYSKDFEESYVLELMNFVKTWGGDRTWWNPGSEMRWFGVLPAAENKSVDNTVTLPSDIYTSQFNLDSLQKIKSAIQIINSTSNKRERDSLISLIKKKLDVYTQSIKDEKLALYYFKAPAKLFVRFFFHSGTYNLFSRSYAELNTGEKVLKIFYSLFYVFTLVFGVCGLIIVGYRKLYRNPATLLVVSVLLYSVILFPLILRQIEFRYFVPAYPFLLLIACATSLNFSKPDLKSGA